jgi:phosphohistidine phosphatase
MERLYILRHGIAVPHGSPDYADDDRPLTPKGERRVRRVAYGIKHLNLRLDRIVSSPLPRAFRTAEIVARVLGDPDLLEGSEALHARESASAIAEWLKTRTDERLLIVGHNPSLSDLIGLLVLGDARAKVYELRKAGMAALTPAQGDDGRMTIDWLARPRLIQRLSDR